MVCSTEVRGDIAELLGLPRVPRGRATWTGSLFTCRYDLPGGTLVLSVQKSSSASAARSLLNRSRASFANSRTITGLASLGLPAFESPSGVTAFVKDDFTLVVNASALSGRIGHRVITRADFAYALSTDVLACWSS